ncbi:MAG: hypothetical protein GQ582_00850 [Methyloprofundus sp.]|nr:hypothetical protein [Methyloprofundus sp.]
MNKDYSLITGGDTAVEYDEVNDESLDAVFLLQGERQLHIKEANPNVLNYLTSSILRKPHDLLTHVQRIIYCYEQKNEAQLYAALADLFVILQESGSALKQRMLLGASNKLSPILLQPLQAYLNEPKLLETNSHTVLVSGIESDLKLVNSANKTSTIEHDPLQIARDYVEYSQLDEAISTLEIAILATPEYVELHEDLLELYKLTKNIEGFNKMHLALSNISHPMQVEWDALSSYFTE